MVRIFFEVPHTDLAIGIPAEALPKWKGHFAYLAHDIAACCSLCFHRCSVTRLTPAVYTLIVTQPVVPHPTFKWLTFILV